MKQQVRILGIDDSPFKFGDSRALIIGALVRIPNYLEGVLKSEVTVDGKDSTDVLVGMISGSRFKDQIKLIMIDGIALAGFNIIDLERLHNSLEIPVLTLTRDEPDFDRMREALKKNFEDWKDRYDLLTKFKLRAIHTEHKPLYACGIGMDWGDLNELVSISTVRGVVPEPLRIAHLVASAVVRGESYGRS